MAGVFGTLFQFAHALGRAAGTAIASEVFKPEEPPPPPPRERQHGEAEFVEDEDLKRRGIIDER